MHRRFVFVVRTSKCAYIREDHLESDVIESRLDSFVDLSRRRNGSRETHEDNHDHSLTFTAIVPAGVERDDPW
jgi:hypothetical protein